MSICRISASESSSGTSGLSVSPLRRHRTTSSASLARPVPISSPVIASGSGGPSNSGSPTIEVHVTRVGWWKASGKSIRPRSVAIEAVRGDQAVMEDVSDAIAPLS